MTANLLTFISSKTKFLHIGLKQQLAKIQNCPLSTTHSARNLGFISDQITALSKSCNFHIRQHRCISRLLTIKTASTIATSIVHSKLDYCNSPYYNGLTENDGHENDGPSKLQGMKLQAMKMTDQVAGHEIAGRENDGPSCRT